MTKRIAVLCLALMFVLGVSAAFAAEDKGRPDAPPKPGTPVMKRLNVQQMALDAAGLSAEQKTAIKGIQEASAAKMGEIFKSEITKEEKLQQSRALNRETQEKINNVMTPEQRQKVAAERRRLSEELGIAWPMRADFLQRRLALSDEQVKGVQEANGVRETKIKALYRESKGDVALIREGVKAANKEALEKITALLTPEQKEKLVQMGKERDGRPGRGEGGRPGRGEGVK